jgi:hypothetical protein
MEERKNKVTSPIARLSFASIFESKRKMNDLGDEYSCVLLFPKGTDLDGMKKLAYQACVAKWGDDKKNWPPNLRNLNWKTHLCRTGKEGWPFRDGDMQDYDGYAGMVSVRVASSNRPAVFGPDLSVIVDKNEVYSGCYVRASISAFAWHHQKTGNKGVSFGLLGLQKVRDGEPFTRRATADDFEPYEDAADASEDMAF